MSQPANDVFSQHLCDDEASYHEDASNNGTATNKPKQQQQQLIPTTTTISNIKLPILKKEEYDIWAMEMEHYLEYIDNDVWKVIQNGNSKKRISTGKDGVVRVLPPVSATEIHAVEKERKARTILLMAIPKEHLRRFHGMDDAKEIWEAIRTRFGGNANSKKMQKAVLKQHVGILDLMRQSMLILPFIVNVVRVMYLLGFNMISITSVEPPKKFVPLACQTYTRVLLIMCGDIVKDSNSYLKSRGSIEDFVSFREMITSQLQGKLWLYDEVLEALGAKLSTKDANHKFLQNFAPSLEVRIDGNKPVGFDKKKLECFKCHNTGHFARECTSKGTNDGKKRDSFSQDQGAGKKEQNQNCLLTMDDGVVNWGEHTVEEEETNHALMAINTNNEGPQKPETSVSDDTFSENSVTNNEKFVSEPKPKEVELSCVTHVKNPRKPMKNQGTPKVNGKNWNEMMEKELGEGYSFIKKKCFVCGSLSHLIKNCDFYEKKMAREAELKKQRVFNTGNGVAKPVWNNANRVNHANHFVPRPVQLKAVRQNVNSVRSNVNTGRENVNSVRQNVNSIRSNVNTGSFNVNTIRTKQTVPISNSNSFSPVRPHVNKVNQRSYFSKSHSLVRRPIVRNTTKMTYSHAVNGNWGTAVKTSAGYNWRNSRPNSNYNSGSNFDHPLKNMEDKGIFDSGCSGHMTGNKDHLDDFEECKGGSVTFGGSKGYITGKGRIRVGNLDFDSVSFVKELRHFNHFSISQICDKQHKVLFTETECLVVSPDFKMPDENQILLKVPRQHNMYSFDMKTPSLTKDYACLIAKATSDESKLWHRRLGHINFKNLNKLVKGNLVRGLPSKNGVAERMNRTLIEAARTMLADSLLPTTFWAEAVSTACYIFNRKNYVKGVGYRWMFDIDYLTDSMNYIPVSLENQTNPHAGTSEVTNSAGTLQTPNANASEEEDEAEELIVVPTAVRHTAAKVRPRKSSTNSKAKEFLTELQNLKTQEKEAYSTGISEDTPEILAFRRELDELAPKQLREVPTNKATSTTSVNSGSGSVNSQHADQDDSDMPELTIFNKPQKGIFDEASYDDEGMVYDFNNLPTKVAEEPKNISKALKDGSWVEAMQEELLQFRLQQVWILVDLPHGAK
ncbi:ribonuclease H-like domain-containing protein, partial [Tanacetum coccineum]